MNEDLFTDKNDMKQISVETVDMRESDRWRNKEKQRETMKNGRKTKA